MNRILTRRRVFIIYLLLIHCAFTAVSGYVTNQTFWKTLELVFAHRLFFVTNPFTLFLPFLFFLPPISYKGEFIIVTAIWVPFLYFFTMVLLAAMM